MLGYIQLCPFWNLSPLQSIKQNEVNAWLQMVFTRSLLAFSTLDI